MLVMLIKYETAVSDRGARLSLSAGGVVQEIRRSTHDILPPDEAYESKPEPMG